MIFRTQRKKKKRGEPGFFSQRRIALLFMMIALVIVAIVLLIAESDRNPRPQAITHTFDIGAVHDIALSPNGIMLAIATDGGVWLQVMDDLEQAPALLTAIAMGPHGEMDVAFRSDTELVIHIQTVANSLIHYDKIQIWDLTTNTMTERRSITNGNADVRVNTISDDGNFLVDWESGGIIADGGTMVGNGTYRISDVTSSDFDENRISIGFLSQGEGKPSFYFSPDNQILATVNNTYQPAVQIVDAKSMRLKAEFATDVPTQKVSFGPENQYIAFDHPNQISVWELSSQEKVNTLSDVIENFGFTADGHLIVETVRGEVALMDIITSEKEVLLSYDSVTPTEPIINNVILRDDRWVIVATPFGVDIWDTSINQPYYSFGQAEVL